MGCYASMPAIRMAAGFVERGKSRVDIVHTELCTLHMDPSQHLPEQLVVQTLFADGLIRYSISRADDGGVVGSGLELITTREEIVPGTEDAMTTSVPAWDRSWTIWPLPRI
jgi:predicted naringenin-chalcone synthase